MHIFKTNAELRLWLDSQRKSGRQIGFAPTMGALHDGHLALVNMANEHGDLSVVSIFVNPTQFNDDSDLENYPRTTGKDLDLLLRSGCDVAYLPAVEEVYPPGMKLDVELDFKGLDTVMEGAFRPGHFAGMATVVWRLLNIVEPDNLYMGQKDFQQFTIVKDMLRQFKSGIQLHMCPTVREGDGLALSSRNLRLTKEHRTVAPVIYRILQESAEWLRKEDSAHVSKKAMGELEKAGLKPEYFSIVDGNTLQDVPDWNASSFIVACTAAWAGDVRLIDNTILKSPA